MRCHRYNRVISDAESIERGYGPTCYAKRQKEFRYQIELQFNPVLTGSEKEKHETVNKILGIKTGQTA